MGGGTSRPIRGKETLVASIHTDSSDAEEDLLVLIYLSKMVPPYFEDPLSVTQLATYCGANNQVLHVSGYLLVASPFFLQRLEGPRRTVLNLFDGIQNDYRHQGILVIEKKTLVRRSYPQWPMRSFDTINSTELYFGAIALMLQSLAKSLSVAFRTIHPLVFEKLMAGAAFQLQDEKHDMIVVTICLGTAMVYTETDFQMGANVHGICSIVSFMQQRLCTVNADAPGLISICGSIIYIAIQSPIGRNNLYNKVVRSCAELVFRHASQGQKDLRVVVDQGSISFKYLSVKEGMRKGRYLYGDILQRSIKVAKSLLDTSHLIALSHSFANMLIAEFTTQVTHIDGRPYYVVSVPRLQLRTGATPLTGYRARSNETALSVLSTQQEAARVSDISSVTASDNQEDLSRPTEGEVTDIDWLYHLDPNPRRGPKAPTSPPSVDPVEKPSFPGTMGEPPTPLGTGDSAGQLLNIIYVSTVAPNVPMTTAVVQEIGTKSVKNNARLGLTGFLLYTKPYFLQYIEGPPNQIKSRFRIIRGDQRHCHIVVLVSRLLTVQNRMFRDWCMKTIDLDNSTIPEIAPMQEVLRILSQHFNRLQAWLPHLHRDMLLSAVVFRPAAYVQCALVAFAALLPQSSSAEGKVTPMLNSLMGFLMRGGELVGFLGPHLVGYIFAANQNILLQEVVDLCVDFGAHVGIASGSMLLVNAGTDADHCDASLYGHLFDHAQTLANKAAEVKAPIVADRACQEKVYSVVWDTLGTYVVGRIELE